MRRLTLILVWSLVIGHWSFSSAQRALGPVTVTTLNGTTPSVFGLSLLDDANAAAARTTLGLSANGQSLITAADYAAMRTLLGLDSDDDVTFGSVTATDGVFSASLSANAFNGNVITPSTGTLTLNNNTLSIGGNFTATDAVSLTGNFTTSHPLTLASDGTGTRTLNIGAGGTLASGAFAAAFNPASAVTFSAAGAASTPAVKINGVPFVGTGTTSFPLVYIADANATASTTLNTAGTYFGINGDGTQDLINALKDGTSVFKVASTGAVTGTSSGTFSGALDSSLIKVQRDGGIYITNANSPGGGAVISLSWSSDGVLRLGNGSNNASGSILLTNLTASGAITQTGTTNTTGYLAIKASTGTVTMPTDSAGFRVKDDPAELYTVDEAGNETIQSPHATDSPAPPTLDADTSAALPIVLRHANAYLGEEEWIHLSALAKAVEELTGRKFVYSRPLPASEKKVWEEVQAAHVAQRNAERTAWAQRRADALAKGQPFTEVEPPPYNAKPKPARLNKPTKTKP